MQEATDEPEAQGIDRPVHRKEYTIGDVVGGHYEVRELLGRGGFGIVYLVQDRQTGCLMALKTLQERWVANEDLRRTFKKEALLWVGLDLHPNIVNALWVEEMAGRLFVAMDYVGPKGSASLADRLAQMRGTMDLEQALDWAIQLCTGMEHACTRGMKCHRDIKPGNILVTQDGTPKVSDFGLAAAAELCCGKGRLAHFSCSQSPTGNQPRFAYSVFEEVGNVRCGTPGYMAPEVYRGEGASLRSDIFSFGIVLWQIVTGEVTPPFYTALEGDIRKIYQQQMAEGTPPVNGPFQLIIERCLKSDPMQRYPDFSALRLELEQIAKLRGAPTHQRKWSSEGFVLTASEVLLAPHVVPSSFWKDLSASDEAHMRRVVKDATAFWDNKGCSFNALGQHDQALRCFENALIIHPESAVAWSNKGHALLNLGRSDEAMRCFDRAIALDPGMAGAWVNKASALLSLDLSDEAIACCENALRADSQCVPAWINKGRALHKSGRHLDALDCCEKALGLDPGETKALNNKGDVLMSLSRYEDAAGCYDQALKIVDAQSKTAERLWIARGLALAALGRHAEAIGCYQQTVAVNPGNAAAWSNTGLAFVALGRLKDAIECFEHELAISPQSANGWFNKGTALDRIGRDEKSRAHLEEALLCYDRGLALSWQCAMAWFNKGHTLEALNRHEESATCYARCLKLAPAQSPYAAQFEYAYRRLCEFREKILQPEPSPEKTLEILNGVRPNGQGHRDALSDTALAASVDLGMRSDGDHVKPAMVCCECGCAIPDSERERRTWICGMFICEGCKTRVEALARPHLFTK